MAVVLALLSALMYGSSDFAGGVASRGYAMGPVAAAAQTLGALTAAVAVLLFPGAGPALPALAWGALSGLGSGVGTLALYHGLAVARMTVVATTSAVLTALIPLLVGVGLGNHLGSFAVVGIVLAIPSIVLVSRQPHSPEGGTAVTGVLWGTLAGAGFALLFIALDQAGTRSGAWPLLPGQLVSVLLIIPFAYSALRTAGRPSPRTSGIILATGVLSGFANLLYLAATGHGELAIVAVLSAMYPAVTVVLARLLLAEHWTRLQITGLIAAGSAIVLVTL